MPRGRANPSPQRLAGGPCAKIGLVPYVVTEPCIGVKDKSCMTVCPVDCIYEGDDMVYINPDECIDCGLCEPECPVTAIFVDTDVPNNWKSFIEMNADKGRKMAGG
jgi:ferredoxin